MGLYGGRRRFRSTSGEVPRPARCEDRARLVAIRRDLPPQGFEPIEAPLGTQMLDERDAQMLAVEIAVEIEEMGLEAQILAAHGRAPAEIGSAAEPARRGGLFEADANRIDSGGRPQIVRER